MNSVKIQTLTILASAALLTLSACAQIGSDQVEASAVYGDIQLDRKEASSSATISATFFVGGPTGTVLRLESPASLSVNGQGSSAINDPILNMVSYEKNVSTSHATNTVVYTDKDGGTYTNTLMMPGQFSISSVPGQISKASGFTISYNSDTPFLSGEEFEITLESHQSSNFEEYALVTGAQSGTQFISAHELAELELGTITIHICRESHPAPQATYPKGTQITVSSCSNDRTVQLIP